MSDQPPTQPPSKLDVPIDASYWPPEGSLTHSDRLDYSSPKFPRAQEIPAAMTPTSSPSAEKLLPSLTLDIPTSDALKK